MSTLLLAIALGMDAFSLGLAAGMQAFSQRKATLISLLTGCFHVVLPLAGMMFGGVMKQQFGDLATYVAGGLLAILGTHMLWSAWRGVESTVNQLVGGWSVLAFSFSVSVDSLSVGVSMGMAGADLHFTLLLFGASATLLSYSGLRLGSRLSRWSAGRGEWVGGLILLGFGVKMLW